MDTKNNVFLYAFTKIISIFAEPIVRKFLSVFMKNLIRTVITLTQVSGVKMEVIIEVKIGSYVLRTGRLSRHLQSIV